MEYPSIFNDVLGPVMRGPSSSHSAASVRVGRLARDLMNHDIREAVFTFDPQGSLAATYKSQGADMGLYGGLLGLDPADEGLLTAGQTLAGQGCRVHFKIEPYPAPHPNTYRIELANERERLTMTAISTGGGMMEILEVDGFSLSIKGDYCETLSWVDPENSGALVQWLGRLNFSPDFVLERPGAEATLVEIKSAAFMDQADWEALSARPGVMKARRLKPVLPVLSRKNLSVPFLSPSEMLAAATERGLEFWEAALEYECRRGAVEPAEVLAQMGALLRQMKSSLQAGLAGTSYKDRILGCQSAGYGRRLNSGELLEGRLLNRMVWYATALMEVKSGLGVFVAAPTAGSCAALPAACLAMQEEYGADDLTVVKALLSAGLVGVFIAAGATFAAETGGCQAECGSASGMIAAAFLTFQGAGLNAHLDGTALALQNIFGLTCDPVAERVEVPCLGKNILAVVNAWSAANMALAGFDPVVPLDEVIAAMDQVGRSLPPSLRCTGQGGLSVTASAAVVARRLGKQ